MHNHVRLCTFFFGSALTKLSNSPVLQTLTPMRVYLFVGVHTNDFRREFGEPILVPVSTQQAVSIATLFSVVVTKPTPLCGILQSLDRDEHHVATADNALRIKDDFTSPHNGFRVLCSLATALRGVDHAVDSQLLFPITTSQERSALLFKMRAPLDIPVFVAYIYSEVSPIIAGCAPAHFFPLAIMGSRE